MKRWVFNISVVLSLLMMLAAAGLWVRSYWIQDEIGMKCFAGEDADGEVERHGLTSKGGTLVYRRTNSDNLWTTGHRREWQRYAQNKEEIWPIAETEFWFSTTSTVNAWAGGGAWSFTTTKWFHIPYWPVVLLFSILPAIWLVKWNKRRKLGPNACPSCGYDLTGNETGVCPECGVGVEGNGT